MQEKKAKTWITDEQIWLNRIHQCLSDIGVTNKDFLEDALINLLKIDREVPDLHDLELIKNSLLEQKNTFKVFGQFRDVRKVCIFGSARVNDSDKNFQMAEEFSEKITQEGMMMVTGAGPGIMEAGNKGSLSNMSFGLNIMLPFEQVANEYIANDPKLVQYNYFFNRKVSFVRETDATVIFPGGFGTHDEAFEVLTLIQTGRCSPRPVIFMSEPRSKYWEKWQSFIKGELLNNKHISETDFQIYSICKNVEEAINNIIKFYRVFHSIAYLPDYTVIRLNDVLGEKHLKYINAHFKHLVIDGRFEILPCSKIKNECLDYPTLPRLAFKFNQTNFSGLYPLIHYINSI
ncbi:TIGR00730 family Rossman fold protein [Thermoproteota archaeon]